MVLLPLILHWRNNLVLPPRNNKDDFHDLYLIKKKKKSKAFGKDELTHRGLSQSILGLLYSGTVPVILVWVCIIYPVQYLLRHAMPYVTFCLLPLLNCEVIPVILLKTLGILNKYFMCLHNLRSQVLFKSQDKCETSFLWKWLCSVKKIKKEWVFTWFVHYFLPLCYVFLVFEEFNKPFRNEWLFIFLLAILSKIVHY